MVRVTQLSIIQLFKVVDKGHILHTSMLICCMGCLVRESSSVRTGENLRRSLATFSLVLTGAAILRARVAWHMPFKLVIILLMSILVVNFAVVLAMELLKWLAN